MTQFPPGFTWGAATSAHQTEGNNLASDWWVFEHDSRYPLVEPSGDACDSLHRYPQDLDLLADAGLASYRFSVEWARVEPAPGEFSQAALAHYQRMVDACLQRGLEPVVTLHHFTNPAWIQEDGGWQQDLIVDQFARYSDVVTQALTGVRRYCTINEPNILASLSGAFARTASGSAIDLESNFSRIEPELTERILSAHRRAVGAARIAGADAGLTLAMTAYTTDGTDAAAGAVAALRESSEDPYLMAAREDDFLGVQVYTRRYATADRGVLPMGQLLDGTSDRVTLTGWNFDPQSLGDCLRYAHVGAPGIPLVVTENGVATNDDNERIEYVTGALTAMHEAIGDGVPVEGYYYWSLLDNFEWVMGYRPTFGLIAVDRRTFIRTPKPSLGWLGRIAKANALPA